jgi:ComF family protein
VLARHLPHIDLARRPWRALLDVLLPPQCVTCDAYVSEPGLLCAECFRQTGFITEPFCVRCGVPFAASALGGPDRLCPGCRAEPPAFERARAALRYDTQGRRLILPFKHADRTELAATLAPHMARAGVELLHDADVLVPVPLHRSRLFHRRYNQAALLAQAIRSSGGPPVAADWLVRRRRTPAQGHLGPVARERNVRGAFAIRAGRSFAGKRVVIVDDVLTTGATVEECARVLKRAGAASVSVLTLARALRIGG